MHLPISCTLGFHLPLYHSYIHLANNLPINVPFYLLTYIVPSSHPRKKFKSKTIPISHPPKLSSAFLPTELPSSLPLHPSSSLMVRIYPRQTGASSNREAPVFSYLSRLGFYTLDVEKQDRRPLYSSVSRQLVISVGGVQTLFGLLVSGVCQRVQLYP